MDKKKLTKEAMNDGTFEFAYVGSIPYKQKEEMAERLAGHTVICDPSGCAYLSYRYNLIRMFLIAEYYTNIDTSDWTSEDGQAELYDYMTSDKNRYPKMCDDSVFISDIMDVEDIFQRMFDAVASKHERISSLSYKIGKAFESVLADGDIVKHIAESREVSEKMVEMLGVFKENRPTSGGLLNFAKK